jgi:hypothetical protein
MKICLYCKPKTENSCRVHVHATSALLAHAARAYLGSTFGNLTTRPTMKAESENGPFKLPGPKIGTSQHPLGTMVNVYING